MSIPRTKNFVTSALSACIVGLAMCPYVYIAIGAMRGFELTPFLVILTLLLAASAFLLWRYFSKPIDHPKPTHHALNTLLVVMEVMSWLVIVTFLFFASAFSLLRGLERIGVCCLFFLMATALCLPVMLISKTALEQRLTRLPFSLSLGLLVTILALSGGVIITDMVTPNKPLF